MNPPRTRTNRLRRSVRPSQAADRLCSPGDRSGQPPPQQHDLQSPVQSTVQTPVRSRLSAAAPGESPLNDSSSDLQQDIIWDTTSPSPHRLGKRGRRVAARVVNISEIVSRIAPESGRPRVLEPTLQQWIGDSATIPCTPELQPPKPKKKSPRLNAVDDLLRLAKQFDFNMLHENRPDQDLNQDLDLPEPRNPNQDPDPDWVSDEDLDYLFDRSTQSISGAFSQSLPTPNTTQAREQSGNSSETKQAQNMVKKSQSSFSNLPLEPFSPRFKDNPTQEVKATDVFANNPSSNHCSSKTEQTVAKNFKFKSPNSSRSVGSLPKNPVPVQDFDDDWGDDAALMDDSLLMELTQNPLGFTSPKCTSTQRNGERTDKPRRTFALTTNNNFYENLNVRQGAASDLDIAAKSDKTSTDWQVGNVKMTQNKSSEVCHQKSIQNNSRTQRTAASRPFQETSDQGVGATRTNSDKCFTNNSSVGFNSSTTKNSTPMSETGPNVSAVNGFGTRSGGLLTNGTKMAAKFGNVGSSNDFGARSRQGFGANVSSDSKAGQTNGFRARSETFPSNNSKGHAPSARNGTNFTNSVPDRGTSLSTASEDFPEDDLDSIFSSEPQWDDDDADDDLLCELCEDVETQIQRQTTANETQIQRQTAASETQRSNQTHIQKQNMTNQTLRAGHWTNQTHSWSKAPSQLVPRSGARDDFTFKRPNPVPSAGPRAGGKCSAAEIELKKQQAMERRRQRQQATGIQPISSLRAPT